MLVLVIPVAALYSIVSRGIRDDAIREAEKRVGSLAYRAVHQWERLMDRGGEAHLKVIGLKAQHWAVVRGTGQILVAGGAFHETDQLTVVGESRILRFQKRSYRVASIPLFAFAPETFEGLPGPVQETVRRESPEGQFLRAKRTVRRKTKTAQS